MNIARHRLYVSGFWSGVCGGDCFVVILSGLFCSAFSHGNEACSMLSVSPFLREMVCSTVDWRYSAFMSCFEAYRSQKRLRAADMQDISYFVLGNKISL
jgi:hypothetical protein